MEGGEQRRGALHPEAHFLGKLRCCRNAKVWHTIEKLKENGAQMLKGERENW